MNGKLIVIDGLDGSGKATQAMELYKRFRDSDRNDCVSRVSFPFYESEGSTLVRMYLRGAFGTDPNDVNAYAASTFYAADRYASYKQIWGEFYDNGGIIVADRYTTSNAIHQCAKLPKEQWKAFADWLFDYEYNLLGLPKPDRVFYLRVEPEVSQKLMTERYGNDETKKDIHERDVEYQNRCREAADYCSREFGWTVIDCCDNSRMLSISEITELLCKEVGV